MIYILHIDTSADTGIVAVTADGAPLAIKMNEQARDHAAALHRLTDEVLKEAGIEFRQLQAVAVCGGPGSYTGLRIGLSAAKGWCYALDIPLILHNKLTLLIHQTVRTNTVTSDAVWYAAVLKARSEEYFVACHDTQLQTVLDPQHMAHNQLVEWLKSVPSPLLLVTDLDNNELPLIAAKDIHYQSVEKLDIQLWGSLAFKDYKDGRTANLANATPFYMKEVFISKKK